ncbi:MAG TPA: cupin domain-containing protein [Candidatus Dormibacteraeota bacterium]|nr:cupin domain-containing protein [Candidatus Dormibacteraeota bacterium]
MPIDEAVAEPLAGRTLGGEGHGFVIAEWADDGESSRERPIAPLHLHRQDDEAWYVLQGRMGFQLGDDTVEVGPGSAVRAAPGVPHTFWNAGDAGARYVIVMTPRIARLIERLHTLAERTPESLRALFEEHASTLLA